MGIKDKFIKIFLFFSGIYFFLPFCFVLANLEINEIMYDLKAGSDDGREWIEILNNSTNNIDILAIRFFEGDTNHKLKLIQGSSTLGAGGYAVIVSNPIKFKIDWPYFSGTILDSSFSLNNSGETLIIKDGDSVLDQYAYSSGLGGAGDGNSLQKINGFWRGAPATPGMENKVVFIPPPVQKSKTVTAEVPATLPVLEVEHEPLILIPTQNLPPNDLLNSATEEKNNQYLFVIILIFLLTFGGAGVYFIRKKKATNDIGEDFEILDEE